MLNDDTIAPGMGFGTHPHDNMEIISIPLEGDLEHKDSTGNVSLSKHGDVTINDRPLNTHDGFGIWDIDKITIKADSVAEFLLMDVPMK